MAGIFLSCVTAASACSLVFDAERSGGADASAGDAWPTDAKIGPDCEGDTFPFALLNVESCDLPSSDGDLNLSLVGDYIIDTDNGLLQDPTDATRTLQFAIVVQEDATELLVLTFDSLAIAEPTRVTAIGSRPLVLVVHGDIHLEGVLAARGRDTLSAAGANLDVNCTLGRGQVGSSQVDENGNTGGSGGGGGALGSTAGVGAIVESSQGTATVAGQAALDLDLVPLRGGCAGGNGGDGLGGLGGYSGGAMQLIAGGTVRIDGRLTASGGGGAGGNVHGGGGGGGSGGGLLVQATRFVIGGVVSVNGGGGGEGSRAFDASQGQDGSEDSVQIAIGGSGQSAGGDGGDGATLNQGAQGGKQGALSAANAAGGGGGGGGAGVIRFVAATTDRRVDR